MRVVRVYHAGRDEAHRARERALVEAGVELRLVVPSSWPGPDGGLEGEPFEVVELDVERPGDVNRHRYASSSDLASAIWSFAPDVVDVHEEPVSLVARQVLSQIGDLPVVMYSAQNLDKRWPPPFGAYERRALARVQAFYPCSRQAAAVLHAKGYRGLLRPLPLGIDAQRHRVGDQRPDDDDGLVLGLVGRLVPEKGLVDAIEVLAAQGPVARLLVVGGGPDEAPGRERASRLGVADRVEWVPWVSAEELAALYRRMHVVLVPSRATATWVEQFGRVITEAGANGAVPVGYDSGSIAEVTADAGVVVPEGDATALAEAVSALVSEPRRWAELRRRGLDRAAAITWNAVAAEQARLYEQAADLSRPGRPERRRVQGPWGQPSTTRLSARPFAAPLLRSSARAHRLASAADRLLDRPRARRAR